MRRKKETNKGPIVIDLTGPEGNAFSLMAITNKLLRQLKYSKEDIDKVMDEMKMADYENLLDVMEHHVGEHVILEESNSSLKENEGKKIYEMNQSLFVNLVTYIKQNLPEIDDIDDYNSWYKEEYPTREGYIYIANTFDPDLHMEIEEGDMYPKDTPLKENIKPKKESPVITLNEKEVDNKLSEYIKDLLDNGSKEVDIINYFKKL